MDWICEAHEGRLDWTISVYGDLQQPFKPRMLREAMYFDGGIWNSNKETSRSRVHTVYISKEEKGGSQRGISGVPEQTRTHGCCKAQEEKGEYFKINLH